MSRPLFALVFAAPLAACSYVPRIPGVTPYRMEIQQGNFISQEMLSQLKSGMSKEQVRLALGTPLLADAFHADRWDYVYWREAPDGKHESRKLVVLFADGKLARVSAGNGEVIQLESPPPPATQAPVAPATQSAVPAAAGGAAAAAAAGGAAAATQSATPAEPQAPAPATQSAVPAGSEGAAAGTTQSPTPPVGQDAAASPSQTPPAEEAR